MTKLSYVSIGLGVFARKVINASSSMFMICQECPNATSIQSSTLARIKNVPSSTLIQDQRKRIALGTTGASVATDLIVGTSTRRE